ncbi:MAG: hypothetical protein AAGA90_24000 [Actinomycetota bacterium]
MTRASELWLEESADAAEVDGEIVHAALTVDLDIDSQVTIVRRSASTDRPQGVALDADQPFTIADQTGTRMVLWSDTAPASVDVRVPAGRLTIWNVWRDDGAIHAWTGSAGIRRIELDDADADFGVRLVAHDGHGGQGAALEVDVLISGARGTEPPA